MRRNFINFCQTAIANFIKAIINIIIFLPYFFSVITLSKTLFYPWKNLISHEKWLDRIAFNAISRTIGFIMRFCLLLFYVILQITFFICIPIIGLTYLLLIPFLYVESLFQIPDNKRKQILKDHFLSARLLQEDNRQIVEYWFEIYYRENYLKAPWWSINRLFTLPPLARDWAMGYTPTLNRYVTDLTSVAYQAGMKNILDRQLEIQEIERILEKSSEANVVIVGDEGVGKRTIINALAKKIYEGLTTNHLAYKRILRLDMEKILAKENLLDELLAEAAESKSTILLIENLEKYISSSAVIEKYAASDRLQIIGITTSFAYQRFIVPNDKFVQLFAKVDVYEISETQALEILLHNSFVFEKRYKMIIPFETIKAAVSKSNYYITDIPFPEKAMDLLDSACIYAVSGHQERLMPPMIDVVLTEKTHIPTALTSQIKEKLINLESLLGTQVIQQKEAINELSSALRRSFILMGLRKKPLAAFLFAGPTGVGKTATAKVLANIFFGGEIDLIRFDMSLYQTKQDIPKLMEMLAMKIRQKPYGVLLLDEIEKADHDLINIFMTILDEAYFTDDTGKKVDCKNLVIIATSNAQDVKQTFSPEFLNRFDGVINYRPLTTNTAIAIAREMIDKIKNDIYKLHKVTVNVSNNYVQELVNKSYNPQYGARDMDRLIRKTIEDKIAKMLLSNQVRPGDSIQL